MSSALSEYLQGVLLEIINNPSSSLSPVDRLIAHAEAGGSIDFPCSFKSINSSLSLRRSFISQCLTMFSWNSPEPSAFWRLSQPEEIHEIFLCFCPDFPLNLIKNASRIAPSASEAANNHSNAANSSSSSSSSLSSSSSSFPCLFIRILLLFYYSEFLNSCALAFRSLDKQGNGKIEKIAFLQALKRLLEENQQHSRPFSAPKIEKIEEMFSTHNSGGGGGLGEEKEILFNSFCVNIFRLKEISDEILNK